MLTIFKRYMFFFRGFYFLFLIAFLFFICNHLIANSEFRIVVFEVL